MNDNCIAITGMACVFPGARTVDEFWRNIVNAVDSVTDVPAGRLNNVDRLLFSPEHECMSLAVAVDFCRPISSSIRCDMGSCRTSSPMATRISS